MPADELPGNEIHGLEPVSVGEGNDVFRAIARTAVSALQMDGAIIVFVDERGRAVATHTYGFEAKRMPSISFEVAALQRTVTIDAEWVARLSEVDRRDFIPEGASSILAVPMSIEDGATKGSLCVFSAKKKALEREQFNTLRRLATIAATLHAHERAASGSGTQSSRSSGAAESKREIDTAARPEASSRSQTEPEGSGQRPAAPTQDVELEASIAAAAVRPDLAIGEGPITIPDDASSSQPWFETLTRGLSEVRHRIVVGETIHSVAGAALKAISQLATVEWIAAITFDDEGATVLDTRGTVIRGCAVGDSLDLADLPVEDVRAKGVVSTGEIQRSVFAAKLADLFDRECTFLAVEARGELLGMLCMTTSPAIRNTELLASAATQFCELLALSIVEDHARENRQRFEQHLILAKEQAEELTRLKSVFLANVSHELRTPLTSIIGFAEVLSQSSEGQESEFASLIQVSGKRLMETVNAILSLAHIEGGTVELFPVQLDAVPIIEEVLAAARSQAPASGLTFSFEPTGERTVFADRLALRRVIANLVDNAVKFTDEGTVAIAIKHDGPHALISVSDTGVGIEESFMPDLFEAFTQESTGLARQFEGTGLGLKICESLVALMGGHIAVRSAPGEGSVFTVRLPKSGPAGTR